MSDQRGLCNDCKSWQIEPDSTARNLTLHCFVQASAACMADSDRAAFALGLNRTWTPLRIDWPTTDSTD